jgi:hypothetical protein
MNFASPARHHELVLITPVGDFAATHERPVVAGKINV